MEQAIQIFSNPQFGEIRTAGTADNPMFCLADVCRALELNNPSQVKSRLNQSGIQLIDNQALCNNEGVSIKQLGNSMANYINESNLYKCIFQSRTEKAELFQEWVTGEVLPSIRKTGGYIAATNDMTDDEIMAKALLVAKSTIERRDQRIKELETANEQKQARLEQASCQISEMSKDIDVMKPKAEYYDMILNNKSTVLTTSIAQDYGMTAIAFNKVLANLGVQRKVAGQWILYTQYIKKGYMQSKPITITRRSGMKEVKYNSEWTQSGRIFLYDILKKNGILPMIER